MAITIKSQEEIEKMRIAGKLAADVLEMIAPHVKAGITTSFFPVRLSNLIDKTSAQKPHEKATQCLAE